ncbi:endopeptidase La [Desulfopila sp. IMCC35006]|uniref:endopeptidase La n=1 Tax=Desulfopila sp. IMCC35006 TaxID=2569542 RepID=UPI0010AB6C56|nr:endopeptidase La [Desulfopila sp. IMCC35006]TKB28594.1 endopeptidase La [Desulfopila sp. IMCC35006]
MFFKKKPSTDAPLPEQQDKEETPLSKLRNQITEANLPQYALDAANKELDKLANTDAAVAEYSVGLNYIELISSLPWNISTKGTLDMSRVQSILDGRHCGLGQVKQRILEFLAAKTLRGSARQNILIVDDEDIARTNMAHVLTKDGFACKTAENGLAALKVLAEEDIDLIISDLKMDHMDGLELLHEVNSSYPEIPVIMVTGFATINSAVQAMKSGAAHYLGKPVNLDELRKTVREVLDQKLTSEMGKGPILCFTGPPGTGKTSVGRAIAEALQLHFIRVSLAGLRDEAELRGHRRTYVGAMPGRIITELKRAAVNNPVFMLDEIDKIGQDFRGDPASVMLEVLDPEQNIKFMDHYLDIPFNLSRIMFIATANDVSKLPGPLLDRMELIEFTGYTEKEKCKIARDFIIPRQLKAAGLNTLDIDFSSEALSRIIGDYTRESGLRNLEREIANVCRKLALLYLDSKKTVLDTKIEASTITTLLGPRRFIQNYAENEPKVGITTGLVWSAIGGEIISVETASMEGSGNLLLTGSLGEVLQESAQAALSLIRSRSAEFGIKEYFFKNMDIHIHFPAGGIAKDGPSAGITIFAALLSLLTKRPARRDIAMTGEMTLSGRILPIGGIREKLLAAQRAGVKTVLLPLANKEEVEILPPDVLENLQVVLVKNADEVIPLVLLPAE